MKTGSTRPSKKEVAIVADRYTSSEYLHKNPTWHADEVPWKAQQIRRMLAQHQLVPHSLCEVGCGTVAILRLLQQALPGDCILWGYEISPQAFALAQPHANYHLHFKLADIQQEPEVHYDLILLMDVLEHLEDYFSWLRNLQLKSHYKVIQLPLDISVRSVLRGDLIHYHEQYGHLHYFTKELALQLLKDAGYHVLDNSYSGQPADPTLPVPWHEFPSHPLKIVRKVLGRLKRQGRSLPIKLAVRLNEDLTVRFWGTSRLLILAE